MKIKKIFQCILLMVIIFTSITTASFAQYGSIDFDGEERTYLLHLPPTYNGTDQMPMVIAMHGGFGSADNLQDQSQLSEKADEEGFIVVYPEGLPSSLLNIRTWNAGWCCGASSQNNVDDVGFINALLDHLISEYAIDVNRIYATGMSNGGFMSYRLACELSDRIAAIAPVACSMSVPTCEPNRPVSVIHFHSYQDTSIPYEGGVGDGVSDHYNVPYDSVMTIWASNNNCQSLQETIIDNAEYTFTKWSNCDCNADIHHYITQDGGHSWPGGNSTLIGDPVSEFINANDLMWAFFQEYSLDCETTATFVENNDLEITFFPNPTNRVINIDIPVDIIDYSLIVYNHLGEIIKTSENDSLIDLSNHSPGVYFVAFKANNNMIVNKLILQ